MAGRQRQAELGAARGRMIVADIASNARAARMAHGLSQLDVARGVRISRSRYSRIERGLVPGLSIQTASRMLAVLGLELSARAYPAGEPIRDAAHAALLARLRQRLHRALDWQTEVPLPLPGDRRAWDAIITDRLGAEAGGSVSKPKRAREICRPSSAGFALKARDGAMDRVVLLLADTRHNRALVRAREADWRVRFPLGGRRALELLGAGAPLSGDAIVLL